MRRALLLGILSLALCPVFALAEPTAVLVDTSRSVTPGQFQEAKALLNSLAPSLVEKGPVALFAFNDEPVKVVDFTTDAAAFQAGVAKLEQGGQFTLLYDAVYAAVKEIEARKVEGLVLLVTDGRDENSAVTLEDASARANAAHVAVVSVGMGALDEKALRRLSTLTGGAYAGRLPGLEAGAVQGTLGKAMQALVPIAPPLPPPPAAPEVAAPVQPQAAPPAPARNYTWLLFLLVLLVLLGMVVGIIVLLKRTKAPETKSCEKCGRPLNLWETECPVCLAQKLAITNPGTEPQTPAAEAAPEIDPALMQKGPASEMLEHTLVMDEVPVLVLQRGKNPPRMFQLPGDQVVSVGRDKVNTISISDQTLSGQHFRIVPKGMTYYLVDLQSTNGTYLNGERVTLKELKPGSVIHAGQCDFTFKREQKRLN